MRPISLCAAPFFLALAAPAVAGWKQLPAGTAVTVGPGALSVSPPAGWNRWSTKPIKKGERWSFDGPLLNRVDFFVGLSSGETFARERNKKREPLPKFSPDMRAPDIAEAFEQTLRVTEGASDFAIDSIEPARFADRDGFTFAFHYTSDEVVRRGEARGAVVAGKLYLAVLNAPGVYYFERDVVAFRQIADSARLGGGAASRR